MSSCYLADRFEILSGEPVIGGLHGATRHFHCPRCLSWMFTRPEGLDHIVNIRTTLLDAPPTEPPFIETYTSTALPWAKTGAKNSFAEFPPMEAYEPLIAAFARRQPV